jgi:hypothetical protein
VAASIHFRRQALQRARAHHFKANIDNPLVRSQQVGVDQCQPRSEVGDLNVEPIGRYSLEHQSDLGRIVTADRLARDTRVRWALEEVGQPYEVRLVSKIAGRRMYLWRAVDDEGEVLDILVQKRRNKHAALKLLRKLLKSQGIHPETITTDKLASYRAAAKVLGLSSRHRPGGMRENNRAEFVRHNGFGMDSLVFQQFTEEFQGGRLVPPLLDQDIEHLALVVDRAPEPHALASDLHDHLIESPSARRRPSGPPQVLGVPLAELQRPAADRLVANLDAPGRHHLLDVAQVEREPELQPHHLADHVGWEPVSGIGNRLHASPTGGQSVKTAGPLSPAAHGETR